MHVVQTITAVHDRYLSATPARQTTTELFHWSQAVALFNRKLSTQLQPQDQIPLWATAAMLGIISFCMIDAATPEEAWPLKPAASSDLEWVTMATGKNIIFAVADSLKPDSMFHKLYNVAVSSNDDSQASTPTNSGTGSFLTPLIQLYEIGNSSTIEQNPYHSALWDLIPLLQIECTRETCARYFVWINHIQPAFQRLLKEKDPRALLLLAYWYAKITHGQWWVARRAWLECQATCLYLERYHANETAIMQLLWFPKMECGLLSVGL